MIMIPLSLTKSTHPIPSTLKSYLSFRLKQLQCQCTAPSHVHHSPLSYGQFDSFQLCRVPGKLTYFPLICVPLFQPIVRSQPFVRWYPHYSTSGNDTPSREPSPLAPADP